MIIVIIQPATGVTAPHTVTPCTSFTRHCNPRHSYDGLNVTIVGMVKPPRKGQPQSGKVWFAIGALCIVVTLQLAWHDFSRARRDEPLDPAGGRRRLHSSAARCASCGPADIVACQATA